MASFDIPINRGAIDSAKSALRGAALPERQQLFSTLGKTAPNFLAERFLSVLESFHLSSGATVAGYWPIGAEMDPRPLLQRLQALGMTIALPAVTAMGQGKVLVFRQWPMAAGHQPVPPMGAHGVPAPDASAPPARPNLVLTPLVAFDRKGWRLGSGLGYYDRALAGLRKLSPPPPAVGIAFAGQEVQEVPHTSPQVGYDQRLDWIVTEREVIRARD